MKKHCIAAIAVAVLVSIGLIRPAEEGTSAPTNSSLPEAISRTEPASVPEKPIVNVESTVPVETVVPAFVFVETENVDRMQRKVLNIPLHEFRSLVGTETLDRIVQNVVDKLEARNRDRKSALVEIGYFLEALNRRIEIARS